MSKVADRIVYVRTWATFSSDGLYRHDLGRVWDEKKSLLGICGLNPSQAGKDNDDPTIRREVRFARDWGYGGIWKVNLYDRIATDPRQLSCVSMPCSPRSDEFLMKALSEAGRVVAAWGAHRMASEERVGFVRRIADMYSRSLYCFGVTKSGAPRHPLYLPATARPVIWSPRTKVA